MSNMDVECSLEGIGVVLTDVLSFLDPWDQSELRICGRGFCYWFDIAAQDYRMIPCFSPSLCSEGTAVVDRPWLWCPCNPFRGSRNVADQKTDEQLSAWSEHQQSGVGVLGSAPSCFGNRSYARLTYVNLDAMCFSSMISDRSQLFVDENEGPNSNALDKGEGDLSVEGDTSATAPSCGNVSTYDPSDFYSEVSESDRRLRTPDSLLCCMQAHTVVISSLKISVIGDGFMANSEVRRVIFNNNIPRGTEYSFAFGDESPPGDANSVDDGAITEEHPALSAEVLKREGSALERERRDQSLPFEKIGDNFLADCPRLVSVDFSRLSRVQSVGSFWLGNCEWLRGVSFSGMEALTHVGGMWLVGCRRLQWAHFVGLPRLLSIGPSWLSACRSLTHAMSPEAQCSLSTQPALQLLLSERRCAIFDLPSLESVDDGWLHECGGLEAVVCGLQGDPLSIPTSARGLPLACDCTNDCKGHGFPSLLHIGGGWLHKCTGIRRAVFGPTSFPNLRSVQSSWLSACDNLQEVYFLALPKLTSVGNWWMSRCQKLTRVVFGSFETSSTSAGATTVTESEPSPSFGASHDIALFALETQLKCYRSDKMCTFTAVGVPLLGRVGSNWLDSCTSLRQVQFSAQGGFSSLSVVGGFWLFECSALSCVDFSGCTSLGRVGSSWLSLCRSLRSVDFRGLTQLVSVDMRWLAGCTGLKRVDFSALVALQAVGQEWLAGRGIPMFHYPVTTCRPKSENKSFVEEDAGKICEGEVNTCVEIVFRGLTSLRQIGDFFLSDCGEGLQILDLSGLLNLQTLGPFAFRRCSYLREVRVVSVSVLGGTQIGLTNLTRIPERLAFDCPLLASFGQDTSPSQPFAFDYFELPKVHKNISVAVENFKKRHANTPHVRVKGGGPGEVFWAMSTPNGGGFFRGLFNALFKGDPRGSYSSVNGERITHFSPDLAAALTFNSSWSLEDQLVFDKMVFLQNIVAHESKICSPK